MSPLPTCLAWKQVLEFAWRKANSIQGSSSHKPEYFVVRPSRSESWNFRKGRGRLYWWNSKLALSSCFNIISTLWHYYKLFYYYFNTSLFIQLEVKNLIIRVKKITVQVILYVYITSGEGFVFKQTEFDICIGTLIKK